MDGRLVPTRTTIITITAAAAAHAAGSISINLSNRITNSFRKQKLGRRF
jgi:hypothetical protein